MPLSFRLLLLTFFFALASGTLAQRPESPVANFARELIKAESNSKRVELLASRHDLVTAELGQELLKQGNFLLLAGKYASAFDAYSLAENVSTEIKHNQMLASAVLNLGTVYYFQGNYGPALAHYRRARTLFVAVRNESEAAKALSGVALVLKEQRKEQEALAAFAQALKEFESLDDKEEMSNTLSSMGAIYYSRGEYTEASKAFLRSKEINGGSDNVLHTADAFYMQGDYAKAADYYEQSLKSFESEGNAAGLISALGGAANSNYYLGKFDEALDYYRRNLEVERQQRDESGVATSLQGIGNVYRSRGDLASALENYEKSVEVSEKSQVKISTAATIGSIGLVKTMQGNHEQASNYFKQSLAQFEETGDKVGMARMLGHLGNAYSALGSYEPALDSYLKSLKLRESMDDKSGQASLLVGIGTVFIAQQKHAEALNSFQRALQIYESILNKEATAYVLTRIADTYQLQGDYQKTLDFAGRAFDLAKAVENSTTAWYARLASGKAQRALDQPDLAARSFTEAIGIVESLRNEPAAVELGDGRSTLLPYLALIELLIDQNKPVEAFELSERSRVQGLSELLRKTATKITRGMSSAEQAQERKLAGNVVALSLQLDRQTQSRTYDEAKQNLLRNQLRVARTAYAEFRRNVFTKVPDLKVARGQLIPLKLTDTQALISDTQTAILEYSLTEDRVYLFALTQDSASARTQKARRGGAVTLKVYPLSVSPRDLAKRVSQFQELMATRDQKIQTSARELYDLLLGPAREQLTGKTNLIVVPDAILWRLPFAALQPADDSYLIDSAAVSYAPSLTVLRETSKQRNPRSVRGRAIGARASAIAVSAFANPVLSAAVVQRLGLSGSSASSEPAASSTPETASEDDELLKLRAVYGAEQFRLFDKSEATEKRARTEAERPNLIMHFAVPAVLEDTMPMYSAIALSAGEEPQLDGMLQAWEVANMNSRARLVVLSDAEVRSGRLGPGDAVVGNVWGWFIAGTPAVALTRWRIDSHAQSQLMSDFHAGVKMHFQSASQAKTTSMAEAMRRSMLSLRRSSNYQHPYYWSGLMIVGNAR